MEAVPTKSFPQGFPPPFQRQKLTQPNKLSRFNDMHSLGVGDPQGKLLTRTVAKLHRRHFKAILLSPLIWSEHRAHYESKKPECEIMDMNTFHSTSHCYWPLSKLNLAYSSSNRPLVNTTEIQSDNGHRGREGYIVRRDSQTLQFWSLLTDLCNSSAKKKPKIFHSLNELLMNR